MDTYPYCFRHHDINYLAMYVNGKQIPLEGLSLDMGHEKTPVMGYKSLMAQEFIIRTQDFR